MINLHVKHYVRLGSMTTYPMIQTPTCFSPACGDDFPRRDGGPLDELSDQLEADAPRAPGYEDAAGEHFYYSWYISPFRLSLSLTFQM